MAGSNLGYFVRILMFSLLCETYPEKLNINPWGRGRKKKKKEVRVGESQSIRDS